MKFEEMSLSPNILSGLRDVNYTELTELQEQALPAILEGQDAIIKASPGKSKNGCFTIPALAKIDAKENVEGITTLILTPNSAEAQQIEDLVRGLGYHAQIECACIDLDSSKEEQREALAAEPQVVVGNPGPLADTLQELRYIFRHVDYLVIDDLSKIISLNLLQKVQDILKRVLSDHQTLIFTDELTDEIQEFAEDTLNEGIDIGFNDKEKMLLNKPPEVTQNLSHGYIYVPNRMKITTLMAHIENSPKDQCIIFTASKRGTDRLYKILRKRNYKATSLHSKLSDEKRSQRFANFTNGDVQFLLVGDLSATTLNITDVKKVINYDVPKDADEYRYRTNLISDDKSSSIVSLVSKQDRSDINELEKKLGHSPKELDLPEKVKQKLKERKKQKSAQKKKQNGKKKSRPKKKNKKSNEMELPRPSYDKLSGGKAGKNKKDEKSGVINMLKNLFS
ncbi:DEAD/DEAH box helicase [Fodinibius salsisoli]|uniref:DEAD/DEAH box helicase n=1 Tax=Fodinibius salsisoli TaxID=2820877 RepID=A0ABT3PRJ4_9BACT|nr:DEAD/DEAH box helicase [Fodinibius salsisoli]MCW9708482.1 DEAD/DEAH box helicase [Fodinibius salsisoli]